MKVEIETFSVITNIIKENIVITVQRIIPIEIYENILFSVFYNLNTLVTLKDSFYNTTIKIMFLIITLIIRIIIPINIVIKMK